MESRGQVFYGWLVEMYHNLWELMVINFLWFVFTLPVLTAPPAAAGLYYAANQLAHEKAAGWRTFFEGFRLHFWLSWRWGLLNALALGLVVSNIVFYRQFQASWSVWVRGVFIGLGVIWFFLQVYTFPLLLEQSDRRLAVALRNSLVLYIKRPGLSLWMAAFILAIIFLCTWFAWPAWIIITAALSAYLANCATIYLAAEIGRQEANGK